MKNTVLSLMKMKESREKISMLTCYDYSTARLMESSGINMILVGDSLGNTMLGYPDTLSVTMEDMIHHGAAVVRGCNDIFVVVDMPFMSYQTSVYDAVVNAGRLIKETGCNAVKLEGGAAVKDQIKAITDAGIPVVAHIGMTPQDAYDVQEAGAFMVVLECVPAKLAALISEKLAIPTIGIGAGEGCDGQVLVYQDMLGMFQDYVPKFVKHFANAGEMMVQAFKDYDQEVKAGTYPTEAHGFKIEEEIIEKLKEK